MLKLFAILIPLASFANSAFAVDATMKKELEKLDPSERMEQACDAEAMKRIGTEKTGFKPDKVIAYTFGDPAMNPDLDECARSCLPQQGRLVSSLV